MGAIGQLEERVYKLRRAPSQGGRLLLLISSVASGHFLLDKSGVLRELDGRLIGSYLLEGRVRLLEFFYSIIELIFVGKM